LVATNKNHCSKKPISPLKGASIIKSTIRSIKFICAKPSVKLLPTLITGIKKNSKRGVNRFCFLTTV
jgi:hypothetical protein